MNRKEIGVKCLWSFECEHFIQRVRINNLPIHYGLGIFKIETPQGIAYMHSGDAIGYYAMMLYFPDDRTTVVYAVNSNYGKIDQFVSTKSAIEKIISVTKE